MSKSLKFYHVALRSARSRPPRILPNIRPEDFKMQRQITPEPKKLGIGVGIALHSKLPQRKIIFCTKFKVLWMVVFVLT